MILSVRDPLFPMGGNKKKLLVPILSQTKNRSFALYYNRQPLLSTGEVWLPLGQRNIFKNLQLVPKYSVRRRKNLITCIAAKYRQRKRPSGGPCAVYSGTFHCSLTMKFKDGCIFYITVQVSCVPMVEPSILVLQSVPISDKMNWKEMKATYL